MTHWNQITIEEFEANSNAVFERVEAGERFKISRNGIVTMAVVPETDREDTK